MIPSLSLESLPTIFTLLGIGFAVCATDLRDRGSAFWYAIAHALVCFALSFATVAP